MKSTNSEAPLRTRYTVVGIVTMLKAGQSGIPFLACTRDCSSLECPDCPQCTHRLLLGFLPMGVEWLGHETNHSPPSSVKVKNEWNYTTTPPLCFHGMQRDTFNLFSFMLPNIVKPMYIQYLTEVISPPVSNNVGICKNMTLPSLYQVTSRLVSLIKCVRVCKFFMFFFRTVSLSS